MAQAPWFFGLSGGVWGQHGMQYMTGEVIAEQLDLTEGLLICGCPADGTKHHIEALRKTQIVVWTWDYLLRTAETLHRDFLEVIKNRAKEKSPDDPRIKALEETDDANEE